MYVKQLSGDFTTQQSATTFLAKVKTALYARR